MAPLPISRSRGRSTRTFMRIRAKILASNQICAYCGHDYSDAVDHVIPRSLRPDLAEVEDNLVPAHHLPCPTCGQRCNRIKGTNTVAQMQKPLIVSENW